MNTNQLADDVQYGIRSRADYSLAMLPSGDDGTIEGLRQLLSQEPR